MFADLVAKYKERAAVKAWKKSTIGQALDQHTRHYFYEMPSLSGFSQENKDKLILDFYAKLFAFDTIPNPFLAMREAFANHICLYASVSILSLKAEEKADAFFADCPYISGELHQHIQAATTHNEELKQLVWTHGKMSDEELIGYCNTRGALYLYYVNGINLVRVLGGDSDKTKDWMKPFLKSMLIVEEHQMRGKLGLPELLSDIDALEHSTFLNMVVNGIANPYYEWEMAFKEPRT